MSEKESYGAEREARREVAAHPERSDRAEGVLGRFLSIISHRSRGPEEASRDIASPRPDDKAGDDATGR